jgi:metal-sulfur cluster biosynthetic enzyme
LSDKDIIPAKAGNQDWAPASAGVTAGVGKAYSEAELLDALRPIQDPEIHMGIVELGLIYGVQSDENGTVKVRMTLTSPACPVGPLLQAQVHSAVLKLPGVNEAKVELVWDPPWDPRTMASDDVKMELGLL